jgi:hypothetical protein
VRDGRISKKYYNRPRAGYAIQITLPDGTYFFYAHLSRYARGMKVGVHVHAGQVIGYVGRTGNAGINHLHFEIHPHGGRAVDPTGYVRRVDACGTSKPATTTTSTTVRTATTSSRSSTSDSKVAGAKALRLVAATFDGGEKTRVTVAEAGVTEADLTIAASHGASRGTLILGDCDHPGDSVLAITPRRTTTTTKSVKLNSDGEVCITTTVDAHVEVSLRRARASDGTFVKVTKRVSAFDSAALQRFPSPTDVFKIRLDGTSGLPKDVDHVLIRLTARSDHDASITVGACSRKRQVVATVAAGRSTKVTALVRVGGGDLCIGATAKASVHVDIVGYG